MIKKDAKKSCWLKTQGRNLKYNYCTDAILSQEVRGPPHPVLGHLADVQVGCGQLLDWGGSRPVKGGKSFTEPQSILLLVQDCLGWDCEQLGWEIFARYSGWQLKFPFLNCIFRSYLFLFRSTSSSRGRLTGPCAGSTPRRPPTPRGSLRLPACRLGENWHCGIKLLTFNFRCIIWRLKTPIGFMKNMKIIFVEKKVGEYLKIGVMSPMITSFLWTWISSRLGESRAHHIENPVCR